MFGFEWFWDIKEVLTFLRDDSYVVWLVIIEEDVWFLDMKLVSFCSLFVI